MFPHNLRRLNYCIRALACLAILSACTTPPPNPPLLQTWRTPRSAAEVLNDGLHLPPGQAQELIASIKSKIKRTCGGGDDLNYQSMYYDAGRLTVSITEGAWCVYTVELRKFFGKWRPVHVDVFHETTHWIGIPKDRNSK